MPQQAAIEQPVPLQADTLSQLPGGGVRTIVTPVMVNGVPTLVQMQVIAMADIDGGFIDPRINTETNEEIIGELREIKRLLGIIAQVPVLDESLQKSKI